MIDKNTVQKTAHLAQLKISSEQASSFGLQFANILRDFSTLQKVDTEGVVPMVTPLGNNHFLREDRIEKTESTKEILANAPDSQGTLYKVPPVV